MTSPEPEDTPRSDASSRPDDAVDPSRGRFSLPDDVDAAFAAIVAGWSGPDTPRWPEDPEPEGGRTGSGPATSTRERPDPRPGDDPSPATGTVDRSSTAPPPGPVPHRPATGSADPDDDHFVPPEPPPLPRIGMSSLVGLLLLVAGVVLLALPALVGGTTGGIVPGLLAMTAGLGWLVVGMRRSADPEDGPDEHGVV